MYSRNGAKVKEVLALRIAELPDRLEWLVINVSLNDYRSSSILQLLDNGARSTQVSIPSMCARYFVNYLQKSNLYHLFLTDVDRLENKNATTRSL